MYTLIGFIFYWLQRLYQVHKFIKNIKITLKYVTVHHNIGGSKISPNKILARKETDIGSRMKNW